MLVAAFVGVCNICTLQPVKRLYIEPPEHRVVFEECQEYLEVVKNGADEVDKANPLGHRALPCLFSDFELLLQSGQQVPSKVSGVGILGFFLHGD